MNENKKLPTLEELKGKYQPEELKYLTDEDILKIFEGVETVWDYNPTQIELGGLTLDRYRNKVEYFKRKGNYSDLFFADMFGLFFIRGEVGKAEKYFNLIEDNETKEDANIRRLPFDLVR